MKIITDMRQDEVHTGQDDFPCPKRWGKMTNFDSPFSSKISTLWPYDYELELSSVH